MNSVSSLKLKTSLDLPLLSFCPASEHNLQAKEEVTFGESAQNNHKGYMNEQAVAGPRGHRS